MLLAVATENQPLVSAISDYFSGEGIYIQDFQNILKMLSKFLERDEIYEMLLVDVELYEIHKTFLFNFMRETGLKIPIICMEPFESIREGRVVEWMFDNEFDYELQFHTLLPLMESIEAFLASAKARGIYEIYRTSKKASENSVQASQNGKNNHFIESSSKSGNIPLRSFSTNQLTPVMKKLYSLFHTKLRTSVSIFEIAGVLGISTADENALRNSVYAYISRLRKEITKFHCKYDVVRVNKGEYKLVLKR
ncbi:MAG: hypothetical protein KBT11_08685 [Treponema sp.]|nr:hypothetical protein [Candidatus Treponema equifaecale]